MDCRLSLRIDNLLFTLYAVKDREKIVGLCGQVGCKYVRHIIFIATDRDIRRLRLCCFHLE